jgi:hypothetical protein
VRVTIVGKKEKPFDLSTCRWAKKKAGSCVDPASSQAAWGWAINPNTFSRCQFESMYEL